MSGEIFRYTCVINSSLVKKVLLCGNCSGIFSSNYPHSVHTVTISQFSIHRSILCVHVICLIYTYAIVAYLALASLVLESFDPQIGIKASKNKYSTHMGYYIN